MGQQQANASDRREPEHVVFLCGSRSVVDVEINRDTASRAPGSSSLVKKTSPGETAAHERRRPRTQTSPRPTAARRHARGSHARSNSPPPQQPLARPPLSPLLTHLSPRAHAADKARLMPSACRISEAAAIWILDRDGDRIDGRNRYDTVVLNTTNLVSFTTRAEAEAVGSHAICTVYGPIRAHPAHPDPTRHLEPCW